MVWAALLLVALIGISLVLRIRATVTGELVEPLLNELTRAVDQYEPVQLETAELREAERHLQDVFESCITGRGLVPGEWRVRVLNDEITGVEFRLVHPTEGERRLMEFEADVENSRIRLDAV